MASVEEAVLDDWMTAFDALPPDRQENVKKWFLTQRVIIEASGLTPEAWFAHVEWALDHPFDYSFIQDFPAEGGAEDGSESTAALNASRRLVGADTRVAAPQTGAGVAKKGGAAKGLERELFDNFMRNRLGGK